MNETQRVAIVTGGSRGIGRETVSRLAADGVALVVVYAGRSADAQAAVEEVTAKGGRAIAIQADIADEQAVSAVFDRAEQEFGGVDVVVNAAGVMNPGTPLVELSLDEFDRIHRTNVRGAFVVAQQAARRLRRGGSIIFFSSTVTRLRQPGYTAYGASKGAVETITLILARELRGKDITVNAVAPGPTATALFLDNNTQEAVDRLAAAPPLERLGEPKDIAEVVAFLAGPARWVNGQVLYANGGIA
ncbi:SDR family oxidoreductase [Actinophytocola sp.]|uniref:SDR family oxidoreductase n=1 Tax=Actinophytocola sp. TaxID=1872138 RepID=UPI002D5C015A|nr:SDR family oxidoreductase [Actinophytocola sp.]HYQ62811.1 SDR family oxidoreductase [Actinophytocola sp.]